MTRSSTNPTVPAPTREEMEFYVRKGKQLQSEAVHAMIKSGFNLFKTMLSGFIRKQNKLGRKTGTPISGLNVHGN